MVKEALMVLAIAAGLLLGISTIAVVVMLWKAPYRPDDGSDN